MTTKSQIFELNYIECSSGLGATAQNPFIGIRVLTNEGHVVIGQMDVKTARTIGMQFLEVAEAALSDAAVYHTMVDSVGAPPDTALAFIGDLRGHRADKDDGDEAPDAH